MAHFALNWCHRLQPNPAIAPGFSEFWGNIFRNNEVSPGLQVLFDVIKVLCRDIFRNHDCKLSRPMIYKFSAKCIISHPKGLKSTALSSLICSRHAAPFQILLNYSAIFCSAVSHGRFTVGLSHIQSTTGTLLLLPCL